VQGGKAVVVGCETCNSVWSCPICAPQKYAERATWVQCLVRGWMTEETHQTVMLTLTVKHAACDDLRWMRKGIADAWRDMARHGVLKVLGCEHHVRSLEVTWGPNGWHPHLHVLLCLTDEPPHDAMGPISEAWSERVVRNLGEKHRPSVEVLLNDQGRPDPYGSTRAAKLTHTGADYLAKLGLEVTSIVRKAGRVDGHFTTWEIAQKAAETKDSDDPWVKRWQYFSMAIMGAKQLTWSKGARKLAGVNADFGIAPPDLTCPKDPTIPLVDGERRIVASYTASEWRKALRRIPGWVCAVTTAAVLALSDGGSAIRALGVPLATPCVGLRSEQARAPPCTLDTS